LENKKISNNNKFNWFTYFIILQDVNKIYCDLLIYMNQL
jgi:hypothetical protein